MASTKEEPKRPKMFLAQLDADERSLVEAMAEALVKHRETVYAAAKREFTAKLNKMMG